MNVLVVEDDRALGLFLQKGLQLQGHSTAWVEDGEAALETLRCTQPDLLVLDLSLPSRDGLEVLEEVRRILPNMGILVLTGRSGLEERVRCLDLGADDFLLKPFSFHELAARCRAILRRQRGTVDCSLRCGTLLMDIVRREVHCEGRPVQLTTKEFSLMEYLLRHQGVCCSREELLGEVWRTRSEHSANVVDVYINYLRRKLAAVASESSDGVLIETVRGSGYRMVSRTAMHVEFRRPGTHPQLAKGA